MTIGGSAALIIIGAILRFAITWTPQYVNIQAIGGTPSAGMRAAVWICLAIAAGGGLLAAGVFAFGGGRLQTPDLERWSQEGEPAWESPPLLARLRPAREAGAEREAAGARE